MRKVLAVLAILVLAGGVAPAPALAQDAGSSAYDALVAHIKSDPLSLQFGPLRDAYAQTPGYDPFGGVNEPMREQMVTSLLDGQYQVAVDLAGHVLEANYVDIGAHVVAAIGYAELKQPKEALRHRRIASELLISLLRSGDGRTPATAYRTIMLQDEYCVLSARELVYRSERLLTLHGRRYHRIVAFDPRLRKAVILYFDVDRPMRWAGQLMAPVRHEPALPGSESSPAPPGFAKHPEGN